MAGKRSAQGQHRPALGFYCRCEHPWHRHGFNGCKKTPCACRSRVISVQTDPVRCTVRYVIEMPVSRLRAGEKYR